MNNRSWLFNIYWIIFIAILTNTVNIYCQEIGDKKYTQIELKEFFDGKGVIFPSDYTFNANYLYKRKRFTPESKDIIEAEKILSHLVRMILGSYKFGIELATTNMHEYYRQYMGVFNEKNNKIVIVQMVDYDHSELMRKEWPANFISIVDLEKDYYNFYSINLDTKELDESSNPLILDESWFLRRKE
jgi:hypothetical protein